MVDNEAVYITYLELSTALYIGRHATSSFSAITSTRRRRYIYLPCGTTPAPAASVHLSADGSSPASAGTPISSNSSSMAIISAAVTVFEKG